MRPVRNSIAGMPDFHRDKERREERAEAFLIAGSTLMMLCGLAALVAAVLIARQERTDRSNASAPAAATIDSPAVGEPGIRPIEQNSRDLPVRRGQ